MESLNWRSIEWRMNISKDIEWSKRKKCDGKWSLMIEHKMENNVYGKN